AAAMGTPTDLQTTASGTDRQQLDALSQRVSDPGFDPDQPTNKRDLQEFIYRSIAKETGLQYLLEGGDAERETLKDQVLMNTGGNASKLDPYVEDILQGFQAGKVAIQNGAPQRNQ